jgi:hypothetical protein
VIRPPAAAIRAVFAAGALLGTPFACTSDADDDDSAPPDDDASPGDDDDTPGDDDSAGDDDDSTAPPVDVPLPDGFSLSCAELEPNDIDVAPGDNYLPPPPWDPALDCGTVPADATGPLVHVSGSIEDIVLGTWDGDKDTASFVLEAGGRPRGVLRWEPLQGDYDAQLICPRGGGWQDLFEGGLGTAQAAEQSEAAWELDAGSRCWLFVAGFDGYVADWDFWLETSE